MHHYQSLGGWSYTFHAFLDLNLTQYLTHPAFAAMAQHIDAYSKKGYISKLSDFYAIYFSTADCFVVYEFQFESEKYVTD